MSADGQNVEPGSDFDLAIDRALQGANLRAGDAVGASTASVVEDREPSAAEAGDAVGGADGD